MTVPTWWMKCVWIVLALNTLQALGICLRLECNWCSEHFHMRNWREKLKTSIKHWFLGVGKRLADDRCLVWAVRKADAVKKQPLYKCDDLKSFLDYTTRHQNSYENRRADQAFLTTTHPSKIRNLTLAQACENAKRKRTRYHTTTTMMIVHLMLENFLWTPCERARYAAKPPLVFNSASNMNGDGFL